MSALSGLKPDRVIKAFQRAGWTPERQKGSHVHMTKDRCTNILSIPMHRGKPVKQGLLRDQIAKAGLTIGEFLKLYK